MHYIPSSLKEQQQLLDSLGIKDVDALYEGIPDELKISELMLPKGKSELEVRKHMTALANQNQVFSQVYRGAGAYHHYIPSIVKQITSKEEFLTAYTPYQAEISQGILQSIFEFQTLVTELTGLPVANASVYDGASAAAEAVNMTLTKKKKKVLVASTAHPMTIQTIQTYSHGMGTEVVLVPEKNGTVDKEALTDLLDTEVASVFVQHPNYYGNLEECDDLGRLIHEHNALFIMGINPIASGILKSPGEHGADIATGEGQPLGIPMGFGGPYLGFMATTEKLTRKLPGRIVGQTTDVDGKRAFVLTLQAREQHIRREKASSNICSNQAHCALTASVYLSAMGPVGMREVGTQCYSKAHYLQQELTQLAGFKIKNETAFFHEFVTTCPISPITLETELAKRGILSGLPIGEDLLWCVTEMNTKEDMDHLVSAIKEVCDV